MHTHLARNDVAGHDVTENILLHGHLECLMCSCVTNWVKCKCKRKTYTHFGGETRLAGVEQEVGC